VAYLGRDLVVVDLDLDLEVQVRLQLLNDLERVLKYEMSCWPKTRNKLILPAGLGGSVVEPGGGGCPLMLRFYFLIFFLKIDDEIYFFKLRHVCSLQISLVK
jgi:hypothetical protein